MQIQIKDTDIPILEKAVGQTAEGQELLTTIHKRFSGSRSDKGNSISFRFDMTKDFIAKLKTNLSAAGNRSLLNQFSLYERMAKDPNVKISRLIHLKDAVVNWLLKDCIKGWIFHNDEGDIQAYVVSGVGLKSPMHGDPYLEISLDANIPTVKKTDSKNMPSITIGQHKLPGTVEEILANSGYMHETEDLHEQYREGLGKFQSIVEKSNKQFYLKPGKYKPINGYANLVTTKNHRGINDETILKRHIRSDPEYHFWSESKKSEFAKPENAFKEIPMNFMHVFYDLEVHKDFWVPSYCLQEYVYDQNAADKIVLPEDHRELINILTEEEDLLIEDVVEGKSGGNIVLLQGEAGLGKTLLAEVYSEKMQRPLYRLPASYLGLEADKVDKQIALIYENAHRWNAVVLIDEADIYIRRRDNDMHHNAIVGTMLIALERQNVLTFMATNRKNDVDEAILSRCIAIVNFRHPNQDESSQIWNIQSKQMGLDIDFETIQKLVEHYSKNEIKTAGRDIRALLKLAYRYKLRRNTKISYDLIISLGAFKGF